MWSHQSALFSPELWGHQMKQQGILFKRNKMLYFLVKHRVNLQNSLLQDAAGARNFKNQTNLWRKNQVSKIKVKSPGTGSGYIQTWLRVGCNMFWGSVTMCLCYSLALQLAATRNSGLGWCWLAIPIFWSRCGACGFALKPGSCSCACSAHLPILIITFNQNEKFPPNTWVLAQGWSQGSFRGCQDWGSHVTLWSPNTGFAQWDLPRETSERRGNQAAHLQVLASVKACFCQKRKQVSFTTHGAQISAEYRGEAACLTNTQRSDMTKVVSICSVQQGLSHMRMMSMNN